MGTVKSVAGVSGVFRGKNMITPNVVGFYQCGDYLVELRRGSGVAGHGVFDYEMFGVTVALDGQRRTDLSKPFGSRGEADNYMQELAGL